MFDPYHKWLGIPRVEQPANHYRLLGISPFEDDPEVIDAAANRQMAYLQGCATGAQVLLSQRLLNEVAAARLCLLNPGKKATYDARLRAKPSGGAEPSPSEPSLPAVRSAPIAPSVPRRSTDRRYPTLEGLDAEAEPYEVLLTPPSLHRARRHRKRRSNLPAVASIAALLIGGLVGVSLKFVGRSGETGATAEKPDDADPDPPQEHDLRTNVDVPDRRESPQVTRLVDRGRVENTPARESDPTAWNLDSPPWEVRRFTRHAKGVSCVAFTSDGKLAVSGGDDMTVRVWDASREVRSFSCEQPVHCIALSRDDGVLATGQRGGDIVLWDFSSGRKIRTLRGHTFWTNGLAFSPDGRSLYSSSGHSDDPTTRLWDVGSGIPVTRITTYGPIALSPDGDRLVIGEFKSPVLRDRSLRSERARCEGHRSLIRSVAFSPDGRSVVSGSGWDFDREGFSAGYDNSVRLWDAATGQQKLKLLGHQNWVYGVAFSPDGRWVVSGGGGTIEGHNDWKPGTDMSIRLWDVGTGKEVHRFTGHGQPVKAVTFSPDGNFVLSGSDDGTARVWRLPGFASSSVLPPS